MKSVVLIFGGLAVLLGLSFKTLNEKTVTFQSLESKTGKGGPVFNEIKFATSGREDIWLMRQGHHGLNTDRTKWDALAIIVDKTKTPRVATFYQLEPGELTFSKSRKVIPFDAECIACHANGPRAIRPDYAKALDLLSRLKVVVLNTRISSYGPTISREAKHFSSGYAFQSPMPLLNRTLTLKSCSECHSEKGPRGPLHVAQISTVQFLVKNKFMPPDDEDVAPEDLEKINNLAL